MKRVAVVLGMFLLLTAAASAQSAQGTVTNTELEKFRQKRLAGERDYHENYARMGFPSPEELEKQKDEAMAAKVRLSAQLREARLERERIELEQERLAVEAARLEAERQSRETFVDYPREYYMGGYGGFGYGFPYAYRYGFPFAGQLYPGNVYVPIQRVTPYGALPLGYMQTQRFGGTFTGSGRIIRQFGVFRGLVR